MKLVAVTNQKGGAGKTTTTMNLAAIAAENSRVLVVDVDPQQSTTWWASTADENLPFDFAADTDASNLARLRALPFDVIFVDTPGNLTDSKILESVLAVADFAIIPTEPEALCIPPMVRTIRTLVEPSGTPFRVLLSKIDMRVPGQLEDAVGGGVSQMGTTTFNAAFFAGLRVVVHTPHEFWITRYPAGREATISWGGPELIFRNDWDAAILMKVTATDTSLTVTMYSSKLERRVTTETTGDTPVEGTAFTVYIHRTVFQGAKVRSDTTVSWSYKAPPAGE